MIEVAQCDKETLIAFTKWVEDLGGVVRVAKINDIHRSTLSRYISGAEELPKLWINFMKISKENAELKQEIANSRRRK